MKKQTNKNTKKIVKGFKAFDIDENGKMVCRDFVYEEGKTYVCNDAPKICESGFHFCRSPLDVLKYYPIIDNNMNIRSSFARVKACGEIVDEGDEGDKSCSSEIKIEKKIDFNGFINIAIEESLNICKNKIKLDKKNPHLVSNDDHSQLASNEDRSQLASSGDYSKLASSGDDSKLVSNGDNCVIVGVGYKNIAKGKIGSWIVLAEYDDELRCHIKAVKTAQIDGKKIKADTFYKLENGDFVEV